MTPVQLAEISDWVKRGRREIRTIQLQEQEFAPVATNEHNIFEPRSVDDMEDAVQGHVWGIRVIYDVRVPLGRCVVTASGEPDIGEGLVTFDFELGPPIRIHVEQVDSIRMAEQSRQFNLRLQDLRDHVALEQHRGFSIERGGYRRQVGFESQWIIACCQDPRLCQRTWEFTEEEIAAAGRADLMDLYGWGAEIESAKLTPPRQRPIAWQRVGGFLGDDE